MRCKRTAAGLLILISGWLILRCSDQTAQAVREGLSLCGNTLVPALFPFLVLSSLAVELGLAADLGTLAQHWMKPVFGVGGAGASALVLGLVGGYAVGAKTVCQLYSRGQCTRSEARKLLAFCCNCGPGFILGVVGMGLFRSRKIGLLLCAVHVGTALLVGVLFRFLPSKELSLSSIPPAHIEQPPSCSSAFLHAVSGSLESCLNITAFVLFFSVLNRLLALSGLIRSGSTAGAMLAGILELSTGVAELNTVPPELRLVSAAFFLGWGGLSVHCQNFMFLSQCGLPADSYMAGKLLHGLLSALLVLPLSRTLSVPTFYPQSLSCSPSLIRVLSRSTLISSILWLAASLAMIYFLKNYGGKSV